MLNKRKRAEGTLPNKTIEYRFVRGKQGAHLPEDLLNASEQATSYKFL